MTAAFAFPSADQYYPIKKWAGVPADVAAAEIHGLVVKDFSPLTQMKRLKALRAVPDGNKQLASLGELTGLKTLVLEHAPQKALACIGGLTQLEALSLFKFGGATFSGLDSLAALRHLVVEHAPKLSSLQALAHLSKLETLEISTPASWDASRRTIKVESLAPLAALKNLRHLTLRGVEPAKGGLEPLAKLKRLETLDVSHVYRFTLADHARLAAQLPKTKGHALQAAYTMNVPFGCKTCGTAVMFLTAPGPRGKPSLCPKCDKAKLEAHVAEFERLKAKG